MIELPKITLQQLDAKLDVAVSGINDKTMLNFAQHLIELKVMCECKVGAVAVIAAAICAMESVPLDELLAALQTQPKAGEHLH